MESVSLRSYSDAYPCHRLCIRGTGKHPNMNVETQIPLQLQYRPTITNTNSNITIVI